MRTHEAVKRMIENSTRAKKTVDRISTWDGNLTVTENAKKLFNGSYQNAYSFRNRFKLSFRAGKRGRKLSPKKV